MVQRRGMYLSVLAECILKYAFRDTGMQSGDMKVCAWVAFVSATKLDKKDYMFSKLDRTRTCRARCPPGQGYDSGHVDRHVPVAL